MVVHIGDNDMLIKPGIKKNKVLVDCDDMWKLTSF